jgi:hypothetical protein
MTLRRDRIEALPQVPGALLYLAHMVERPRTYTYDPPPGVPRSNIATEEHVLPIHDMRPVRADA